MWNMNDINAANERIEEIRRAADQHNAIARMKAAGQDAQPEQQPGKQAKQPVKQPQSFWENVRKALR